MEGEESSLSFNPNVQLHVALPFNYLCTKIQNYAKTSQSGEIFWLKSQMFREWKYGMSMKQQIS